MKVAHIQLFNLCLIEKVLFYTGLWNMAHCKTNNFWKLQLSMKAEGTQVVTSLFYALIRISVWNFVGRHELKSTLELCHYVDATYHVMPKRQSFTSSPRIDHSSFQNRVLSLLEVRTKLSFNSLNCPTLEFLPTSMYLVGDIHILCGLVPGTVCMQRPCQPYHVRWEFHIVIPITPCRLLPLWDDSGWLL